LLAAQRPDGGWAFAALYPWDRSDGKEQDLTTSDGYGTGFVVFVLRKAGVRADHSVVARGVAWLKSHQRASGRWFTRSLNKDNEHFLSHAGSAYSVMALAACGNRREQACDGSGCSLRWVRAAAARIGGELERAKVALAEAAEPRRSDDHDANPATESVSGRATAAATVAACGFAAKA
jgi:hypothetical protein